MSNTLTDAIDVDHDDSISTDSVGRDGAPSTTSALVQRVGSWTTTAMVSAVAIAVSIPVLVIVWSIVQPSTEVWEELWATRLPGMIRDTATLLVTVLLGTLVLGTVARVVGDRVPVPRATPARLAAGDTARDPRLRARLRLARHVPGTARRPRGAVDLVVRAGAHDHVVPVRLPVRDGPRSASSRSGRSTWRAASGAADRRRSGASCCRWRDRRSRAVRRWSGWRC